ncbi:hypothetical protein COLO4_07764 [Corchorus olitorius]|uniref:J domain-containing protein n=1 Tax=Corchorus olitorius TaxID=93759 RepID=A0A1R3KIQ5_9ROSI|nr:hypothetical protein COLO4_07764 [Corchorus olitorius]
MYAAISSSSSIAATPFNSFSPISRQRKAATAISCTQTASFKSATATGYKNTRVLPLAGSLYEILRVERTASLNEIKTAYRSLAKMYHPDATGSSSDGRDFIEIRNAYTTLSDPMARAMYDMSLGAGVRWVRSPVYPSRRWETDQCW